MIVFIAGPYGDPSPAANVDRAIALALRLRDLGYTPHVPHLMHFAHRACPRPYGFWLDWCLESIESLAGLNRGGSTGFVLLRMPGESPGADREVELAMSLDVPVCHRVRDLLRQFPPASPPEPTVLRLPSSQVPSDGEVPERPVRKPRGKAAGEDRA